MLSARYYCKQIYEGIVGPTDLLLSEQAYWNLIEQELVGDNETSSTVAAVHNIVQSLSGTSKCSSYKNAIAQLCDAVGVYIGDGHSVCYALKCLAVNGISPNNPLRSMRFTVNSDGELIYNTENADVDFRLENGILYSDCLTEHYDFNIVGACCMGTYIE